MDWAIFFQTRLQELEYWRNLLDIMILAMILTGIYHAILKTNGSIRMTLGLALLVVLYMVAKYLNLIGLVWIFTTLSPFVLILMMVLFQPELRRALSRSAIFFRKAHHVSQSDSTMISETAKILADQRHGAIFVVPGKESLAEHVAGGVTLNGEISIPLMLSIFDPHSPGHDGALILGDGLILQYGVRLPIHHSATLNPKYGTRHHASLSLSQVTDALVIAVSEERGTISGFKSGQLETLDDVEGVKGAIEKHLKIHGDYHQKTHVWIKYLSPAVHYAISLFIVSVLWIAIVLPGSRIIEKTILAPVEYTSIPDNMVLVGEKWTEIKLHVSGPKNVLETLSSSASPVRVDLSGMQPGMQKIMISNDMISLPKNIKLLDSEPEGIDLNMAAIVKFQAPVSPQLVGELEDGLKIKEVQVVPATVTAIGTIEQQKGSTLIMTTPIYLAGITSSTSLFCKLIVPPYLQPAEKKWPDVEVKIVITKKRK